MIFDRMIFKREERSQEKIFYHESHRADEPQPKEVIRRFYRLKGLFAE